MLWVILGDYSSGKTFRLVLEGCSKEYKDIEIWGNFKLDLPNYTKIEVLDLKDLGKDKLVLLDEMQTWIDSRFSMSYDNIFISNILDQCDKRGVDVFGTAHSFGSLDIRFRKGVHRIILCERIGERAEGWKRKEDFRDFEFFTYNRYTRQIESEELPYSRAEKYFPIYDTSEVINYPNDPERSLDMLLRHNPKKAEKVLDGIAIEILKWRESLGKNGTINHSNVIKGLLHLGYSPKYERLIYSCIQDLKEN